MKQHNAAHLENVDHEEVDNCGFPLGEKRQLMSHGLYSWLGNFKLRNRPVYTVLHYEKDRKKHKPPLKNQAFF